MTDTMQEIAAELEDVAMQLAEYTLPDEELSVEQCQNQAALVTEELQRLRMAAEMLDYPALLPVCDWLCDMLLVAAQSPEIYRQIHHDGHLFQWVELLAANIRQQDTLLLPELNSALTDPIWPKPLGESVLQELLLSIVKPQPQTAEPETQSTQSAIASAQPSTAEAVVNTQHTAWDADVHPEILSAFLADTPDQITESTALIHKIAHGTANKDEHRLAARLTHTIKGACGVVGIDSMAALAHQLEEILEYSVEHKLSGNMQELLSASADCLDSMGEAILNHQPLPESFNDLLPQLNDAAKQLSHVDAEEGDEDEVVFDPPAKQESNASTPTHPTTPLPLPTDLSVSQTLFAAATPNAASSRSTTNEPSMRVPISLIDDLLNLAEELVTSTSQVNDRVKLILQQSQQLHQLEERVNANMDELEHSIDRQLRQGRQHTDQTPEFDQLELEVYNELHSAHALLSETLADNRDIERSMQQNLRELSDQLHSQQRINRELNTTILDTRMESLETLTPRLERIVRETCRSTNKKAELVIRGSDMAVDTDILKGLTDPLLHLLRNAVDHGIEPGKQRLAKGKDETGHIELSFQQEGRYVSMTLRDDGQGMDPERIHQRALSQGVISPEKVLNDNEKLQLILLAGFTTKDAVSNISGRGVGMDVVRDAVLKLRGTLELESIVGEYSAIHIRLPLTLVAANTLMASVAGNIVSIPVESFNQLSTIKPGKLSFEGSQASTQINDQHYQVRQLSHLLGWGNPRPDPNIEHNAILIHHNQQAYALLVDSLLQPREVVVKSLAPWLSNVSGIIGACLLSDGAVSPVLDMPRLFQFDTDTDSSQHEAKPETKESALVMIVDDSLSNRKALSIAAEQLGYRTVTAVDGEEALQMLDEATPDIIFSDLEMPRMNGLAFAQAVRQRYQGEQLLPFVMITSRATNKHRQQAKLAGVNDYLVKPVDRETLQSYLEKWLD
ncbi:MAG: hypothetical protein CSB47_05645 [Proteobacteria bacterium]|nr:MAG: hypothetical protein CSB47_05645 [Pseudomonadota bacterium]